MNLTGTCCVCITRTNWLMLFWNITTVNCNDHRKQIYTAGKMQSSLNVMVGG
jgi:hypothetical protein